MDFGYFYRFLVIFIDFWAILSILGSFLGSFLGVGGRFWTCVLQIRPLCFSTFWVIFGVVFGSFWAVLGGVFRAVLGHFVLF